MLSLTRLGLQAVQHKSGMVAHAGHGANYFHYPKDLLDQIGGYTCPIDKIEMDIDYASVNFIEVDSLHFRRAGQAR
ncbi:MAG: hypothetical protein WCA24_10785 [Thiomonas sp.]